jgi:glycerate 2-kinase
MNPMHRSLLQAIFRTAVAAVQSEQVLPAFLPPPPAQGRLIILAAGKAAAAMTAVAERHYLEQAGFNPDRITGIAVTRTGYGRTTQIVPVVEAGHPIPDAAGLQAARRALELADHAGSGDLVLALVSGGASANWTAPAPGLDLAEKQAITRALLRSGASIGEINTVRKHLSRIKGGRLARHAFPAELVTLAISDVPGDDPAVIGSGPTVPDPSTLADARAIIRRYRIEPTPVIVAALAEPSNETPKPGDATFRASNFRLIARPADAFRAAEQAASAAGYEWLFLGDNLEGEAREVAAQHAQLALRQDPGKRGCIILSGGELTVTLHGKGRGGPNQEYALALAITLAGAPGIAAIAADTDGTDGGSGDPNDPAGAYIDATTLTRAQGLGLDPQAFLSDNDSTEFFATIGDLVTCGPTYTNVNDFRAILVDRS